MRKLTQNGTSASSRSIGVLAPPADITHVAASASGASGGFSALGRLGGGTPTPPAVLNAASRAYINWQVGTAGYTTASNRSQTGPTSYLQSSCVTVRSRGMK